MCENSEKYIRKRKSVCYPSLETTVFPGGSDHFDIVRYYITRTNCPYAATFLDIYPISPPIIYIYLHKYIYTYIFTCSTPQFSDNIFIQDAMPEKAL